MSDMQVQAELVLKDKVSKPAGDALDKLGKSARNAGSAIDGATRGNGARELARDAREAARGMDAVASAGGRSQGILSGMAGGARRVAEAMRNVSRHMRDAVAHVGKLKRGLDGGLQGAAALGGAGYAVKSALDKPVQYEKLVASMANVAFAERDAQGRIAGMKDLDAAIVKSVRQGGGTREQGAAALNAMLASGAVDEGTAKDVLLPVVMKASTASGASPEELVQILVKGISQKQFTAQEAQAAIDKAIKAGEAGQFELRDMARWLPQIISAGKGMKGMAGFEAHLANLQAVAQVTGSNDQAGNAYFNLLGKITSTDAANNFKKRGINLAASLAKARMEGQDPVTAFVDLIQTKVVGKNKNFQALQKKIAAATNKDERRQYMEQAAEILQGTAVGTIIQDREALLGLVGVMNGRETIQDVRQQLTQADGATDRSYQVMASTTAYRQERVANEKDIAASAVFDAVKDPLDAALDFTADAAQNHPGLAAGAAGAGMAGSAYMAGSGVSALWGWLRGGAAKGAIQAGATGAVAEGAATGTAAAAEGAAGAATAAGGKATSLLKAAGKVGGVLAVAGSALEAVNTERDDSLSREEKNARHTETAGGLAGGLAGAKAGALGGAALGSLAGPIGTAVGTAVGGLLGGAAGYFSGSWLGKKLGGRVFGGKEDDKAEPPASKQDIEATVMQAAEVIRSAPLAVTLNLTVELDGEVLARKVEQAQLRQATRR